MPESDPVDTGVIGVGSMGRHHARVYSELPESNLVGVADADDAVARSVADDVGAYTMSVDDLLAEASAVSVAVPTRYHYETCRKALERDVDVLVEKPYVKDLGNGRTLREIADRRDRVLQVGHVERFNPAVRALEDIVDDLDVIAVEARRLGPPMDRDTTDSVVLDLMIHDIDVVCSLIDEPLVDVTAAAASEHNYSSANLRFENDVVATLMASRVTQQKIRDLSITARSCRVHVDYADQTVRIHRHSLPEYIEKNGDLRYRHESIIERPTVENGEPLKKEIDSFLAAVRSRSQPVVTAEDGLTALEVAQRVDSLGTAERETRTQGVFPR